jgi:hypothetical protein
MGGEEAGRALDLAGHLVDHHGRGGGGDDRLGARKHRCPSRHIALEVEHFRHGLKDHRHRGQGGPGVRKGDNRDPPCHRPGMGFREQADASKARHRRRIVRNRNSTWPRLSA